MSNPNQPFIAGVVEGFYGRPWNARQRHQLFRWMREGKLNTYLYAPKDDLKHRSRWREAYSPIEEAELGALIRDAERHGVQFYYAIAPGLDIAYSGSEDIQALRDKAEQLQALGCENFAILFDDIPAELRAEDLARFGSLAGAQCATANDLLEWVRRRVPQARLLFCPTSYCGRMAERDPGYLQALGERLHPAVGVLWTGPEIISESITPEGLEHVAKALRRKPLVWDNLHANDYDARRLYLGPYSGRPGALRDHVAGILSNPNCQFEANYIPVRTLAKYVHERGEWNPREAYEQAIREWRACFSAGDNRIEVTAEDLEFLGDVLYLPHSLGIRASRFLEDLETLLSQPPDAWGDALSNFQNGCEIIERLFRFLPNVTQRDLLHTLYPFVWELKEELNLVADYLAWRRSNPPANERFVSKVHRPPVFRGGFTASLHRLMPMDADGTVRVGKAADK